MTVGSDLDAILASKARAADLEQLAGAVDALRASITDHEAALRELVALAAMYGTSIDALAVRIAALEGETDPTPPPPDPEPEPEPEPIPWNWPSFQAAVTGTAVGGTLVVPARVFTETVTISKRLTIKMQTGTVIDGGDTRQYAFIITAADVTIEGGEVRNHRPPYQRGAINSTAARTTIRNVWVHDNPGPGRGSASGQSSIGGGISITGGSALIDGCLVERNQTCGIHLNGVNAQQSEYTVRNCVIRGNNPDGYLLRWHSGGVKVTKARFTFENNEVYGNRGDGLWSDISTTGIYRGNRLHHNTEAGIHHEISDRVEILDNVIWECGHNRNDGWGWGAGIQVVESREAIVRGNIVAWSNRGISFLVPGTWRDRTSFPPSKPGVYDANVLADNVVIGTGSNPTVTISGDGKPVGIAVSGTRYTGSAPNGGGVVLSTAERDAILSGAGVPKGRS